MYEEYTCWFNQTANKAQEQQLTRAVMSILGRMQLEGLPTFYDTPWLYALYHLSI
jgi:hypothetical protein